MKRKEKIFIGILSYLTIIGWVLALIHHNRHNSVFTKFHLQQALPVHLASMIFYFIPFLRILNIIVLIYMIIGFIYAGQGLKKHLPIIGEASEELLSDL